jgi:hypothetical protein
MVSLMKYRPQRGGFDDSMREAVEIEQSLDALAAHLKAPVEEIEIVLYAYDYRLKCTTYLILVCKEPVGFTDKNPLGDYV